MNTSTKQLLEEMVSFGRKKITTKHLKLSKEKLTFDDLNLIISKILTWQKFAHKNFLVDSNLKKEFMSLSEPIFVKFQLFFEYCPTIKNIFQLKENKIVNSDLISKEEANEIKVFINDNYELEVRIRRRL